MTTKTNYDNKMIELQGFLRKANPAQHQKCRTTTKTWRVMLLRNADTVTKDGRVRKIIGRSIGAGVYELSLE